MATDLLGLFGAMLATYIWQQRQVRIAERRRRAVAAGWYDCVAIEPVMPRLGDVLAEIRATDGKAV